MNRDAPPVLNDLEPHDMFQLLIEIAANPATEAETLLRFGQISDITTWLAQPALVELVLTANPPVAEGALEDFCAMRVALAGNPNTPVELLLQLAAEFPREFLANPALPLLLLENPRLLEPLPSLAAQRLLALEDTPHAIVRALASTPGTTWRAHMARETAQFHVNAALDAPSESASEEANAASGAMGFTADLYHPLMELGWSHLASLPHFFSQPSLALLVTFPAFWEACAGCPDLTLAQLRAHLAHDPVTRYDYDQASIAIHPAADTHLLASLAAYRELPVCRAVARNPQTPPALLAQLATNEEWEVRSAVAQHATTPAPVLERLATDALSVVRSAVAGSQITPPGVLAQLGRDPAADVRKAVAANPSTPRAAVMALLDDDDLPVREALMGNPRLPMSDLVRVFTSASTSLRRAAAQSLLRRNAATLGRLWRRHGFPLSPAQLEADTALPLPHTVLAALLDDYQEFIPQALAKWPHASPRLLAALAATEYKTWEVNPHPAVARHRNTPASALRLLVQGQKRYGWVQTMEAMLQNPAAQPELLDMIFLADPDRLGRAVMRHPAMTDSMRISLYKRYCADVVQKGVQAPDEQMEYSDKSWQKRLQESEHYWSALASPHLDQAAYYHGAAALDWRDRCVVAHNEGAPYDEIERLAGDGNRFVRAAARVNLARRKGWTCERVAIRELHPPAPSPKFYTPGYPESDEVVRYVVVTLRLTPPDAASQGVEPATIKQP